ncbi:MAG TPA: ATP-binding protein, partial [Dehalococcoidia bacterium]|nr:ATP-binding protein [Dehalococcoidia bacterium]
GPVRPAGRPEVARLTTALDRLAQTLAANQARLDAEERRFRALLDHLADGVLMVDAQDTVVLANPAIGRMLGRPSAELLGRRVPEAVWDVELTELIRQARRAVPARREQMTVVERALPRRFWRAFATRLDEQAQVLLVVQDLTEVRRLETVRRDFFANISHELRTPVAAIKALAETLEDGALEEPEVARDFVGRILSEADALGQLVEELLQLARIQSGQAHLERQAVDLAALVERSIARLTPLAERNEVTLQADVEAGVPMVRADPERIGQVLGNLLHNAIKFTPPGGRVTVTVGGVTGAARVAVSDTGIGIAADEVPRVFERFYKADRSRASGGTGLGLAIAKHLIQAHGGQIEATSPGPGGGATFAFTLPIEPASAEIAAE